MGLPIFSRPSSRITLRLDILSLEHTASPKCMPFQASSESKNKSLESKPTGYKEHPLRLNTDTQLSNLASILSRRGSLSLCFLEMVLLIRAKDILLPFYNVS